MKYIKCPYCDDEFLGFCLYCMDSGVIKVNFIKNTVLFSQKKYDTINVYV